MTESQVLHKKIAVVTGASSGIGRAFALELGKEALDEIWLIARRQERLEALSGQMPVPCRIFSTDLREPVQVRGLCETLEAEKPNVRFLVNSAGFGLLGTFENLPLQQQLEMADVNIRALTHLTHGALPFMHAGGIIFNISSSAGFAPLGAFSVYGATKAYVNSFSAGLKAELSGRGVHCLAVCPGPVDTEFGDISRQFTHRQKNMFSTKATSEAVVRRAFIDARKLKTFSIYGAKMRISLMFTRIFPAGMLAGFAMRFIYRKTDSRS